MRAFYINASLCQVFLCLRAIMQAFDIYAPLFRLLIFTPHYAGFYIYASLCGFLKCSPTMEVFIFMPHYGGFHIYAPLCGLIMFIPHYASFFIFMLRYADFVWPFRGRTHRNNKMSALACLFES